MPRANHLPSNGSTCTRCKQGIIKWHACGSTCQYCGVSHDNGLTIEFKDLRVGEVFIFGGEYHSSPEHTGQKIEPRGRYGDNVKILNTGLYGRFGPSARVLPLSVTPQLKG